MEYDRRNSAVPMLDVTDIEARIEPGAFIRDRVKIGKNAVVMMGAVINIGAEIGEGSMVDMNAVLGARATVGKNVHVGAGSVLAGVLEPPSATPVIVEDGVMIGGIGRCAYWCKCCGCGWCSCNRRCTSKCCGCWFSCKSYQNERRKNRR